MTRLAHVTIVGAGAMGCLFAARIATAGRQVMLVDSDTARVAALARDGVTVRDEQGEHHARVSACLAGDAPPTDLVILFTKGMHSEAAIRSVAHLAAGDTLALTLQNGLGNAEAIAGVFAADRILIGATDWPADLTGPTSVSTHGAGTIKLGAFADAPDAALRAVADLLAAAGLAASVDPTVRTAIWEKVAFNAALNTLAALTGLRVGQMNVAATRRIASAVVREAVETAAGEGVAVDPAAIEARIDHALAHHLHHKASMLQDREAGRRTEIESINGAIERIARAQGRDVPVTATLADLVRLVEAPAAIGD
ncbi:ketopantoate reductase family protein [Sphingomonas baiyangensis]|uniref:2-dehydropantoate 2-reductase n=1 Tax=Sphingomonas baiyangensis TaxID=2572576 RepID=A0A4U1L1F9_9SPHN|nr:ketopantoate reductase family protein [Sphingomonas baiyangensis]TKD50671.1 ketopantoate reductase family protein [Sphingomonas baiyangensis]